MYNTWLYRHIPCFSHSPNPCIGDQLSHLQMTEDLVHLTSRLRWAKRFCKQWSIKSIYNKLQKNYNLAMTMIIHSSTVVSMKTKTMSRGGERAWYIPSVHALIFVVIYLYSMGLIWLETLFLPILSWFADAKLLDFSPRGIQYSIVYCPAYSTQGYIGIWGMQI